jgi:hypothetical protein
VNSPKRWRPTKAGADHLRTSLWLASTLVALLVLGLWWKGGLSSREFYLTLASALVSIIGALMITEIFLKPVYTKDVIGLTSLSHRLFDLGVKEISEESRLDLDDVYQQSMEIAVATGAPNSFIERHWPAIKRACSNKKVHVRLWVHVDSSRDDYADAKRLLARVEDEWKACDATKKGGSISLESARWLPAHVVVVTDSRVIVPIGGGQGASDPVLLVSEGGRDSLIRERCREQIRLLAEKDGEPPVPFYVGGKVPKSYGA